MNSKAQPKDSSPDSSRRKIAWLVPRISLRGFLLIVAIIAVSIGLFTSRYRAAKRQEAAVGTLLASDAEIRYAYEFDEDGNEIKNPQFPAPTWLRERFGIHWFVTPVLARGKVAVPEIAQLTTLKRIEGTGYEYNPGVFNFGWLKKMKQLESLKWRGLCEGVEELPKLVSLKHLDINFFDYSSHQKKQIEPLQYIGKLTSLESLELSFIASDLDVSPLASLKNLKQLTLIHKQARRYAIDIKPLAQLDQLEELKVHGVTDLYPVRKLTNLIRLDLVVNRVDRLDPRDLERLNKLRINCSEIDDLSVFQHATGLEMLELEHVQPKHDFKWLQTMQKLTDLKISRTPLDANKYLMDFAHARYLRILQLPKNSIINRDDLKELPGVSVYVGDKLVK